MVTKTFEQEKEEFKELHAKFSDAAFPLELESQYECDRGVYYKSTAKGMSKREYFAAKALQGICASDTKHEVKSCIAAAWAVEAADFLIEELQKVPNDNQNDG